MNKPYIKKRGTLDIDMVETTPVVYKGKLYRFEYVRSDYHSNKEGASYFRFVNMDTGAYTTPFAHGHYFGSAFVDDDYIYAFGTDQMAGPRIYGFKSSDMINWERFLVVDTDTWTIFNNSVCKGADGYVIIFEVGSPEELVGQRFTNFYAISNDLLNWEQLDEKHVLAKDRYTACPAIRYYAPYYYIVYLEQYKTNKFDWGAQWNPHIVRTKDFINYESSIYNPILEYSEEDKKISPKATTITMENKKKIQDSINCNNSDVDFCEFKGKTIITYSWGNQHGIEHLADAVYDGGLNVFLTSYFE